MKVSAAETNGAMTVMQFTTPVGAGPPPHTHDGAETVYVVDGTLRYHIGDATIDGGPGSIFHLPAGTLEYWEPTSTVTVLATYTPGGIDEFFAEAGEPAGTREIPPPPDAPPDFERLAQIAERYGLHIQAP